MSTFWYDLMQEVGDEAVEAVVLGNKGARWYSEDDDETTYPKGEVLTPEAAFSILNYEYDTGYGGVDCHEVYMWTNTKVIFVVQYDGSTSIHSVPRNPVNTIPEIPGG